MISSSTAVPELGGAVRRRGGMTSKLRVVAGRPGRRRRCSSRHRASDRCRTGCTWFTREGGPLPGCVSLTDYEAGAWQLVWTSVVEFSCTFAHTPPAGETRAISHGVTMRLFRPLTKSWVHTSGCSRRFCGRVTGARGPAPAPALPKACRHLTQGLRGARSAHDSVCSRYGRIPEGLRPDSGPSGTAQMAAVPPARAGVPAPMRPRCRHRSPPSSARWRRSRCSDKVRSRCGLEV